MRGIERRMPGPGRRAVDLTGSGPGSWSRVLVLAIALAVAAYVLLYARQAIQPGREVAAYRTQALTSQAVATAAALDASLAPGRAGARAAAQALSASSSPAAALTLARQISPTTAYSIAAAPREPAGAPVRLAADRKALMVVARAGGSEVIGRLPLPSFAAGANTHVLIASRDAGIIANSREGARGGGLNEAVGLDFQALQSGLGGTLEGQAGDKPLSVAVARVGDTGLLAVASVARPTTATSLMDDAWVLATPLALGLVIGLLHLLQRLRHARIRRGLAETERRFRIAVEGARCGVWEWDLETDEVTLSDYMAVLFGFEKSGPVRSDAVMARIHPRYREAVSHALRQAASYGAFETSFAVVLPDGGARWIDARGQAHGTRGETGYTSIIGVALDITEARNARAQAQSAESRLRDGIESVSDAFVLFDRQGRLILWNQAFQDAFGFDSQALKRGALKDELNKIAALAIRVDRPSASGRAGTREVELNDGRWLQLSERFTGDGGSVVTAADITLIKKQEAERQRTSDDLRVTVGQLEASQEKLSQLAREYEVAMTRAEAANQAKSEFLANMSHELRTPLNAINGFSEIMEAELFGPLGDARYKGYAKDILQSGQHLLSLINDILDMAKIEAGKMTLHYEAVALVEVCEDAIRLMRGRAEEAGLKLVLEPSDLPEIQADYRALKQVLLNLLSNALKFTPEGGRITVSLTRTGADAIRLSVTDTGIGIAPEDLNRLAQPFEQVEGQHSKTTQGTGLGLALTKSLIEMHKGTLAMASQPGHGTTVSVTLPIRRAVDLDEEEHLQPHRVRAA